MMMMILITSGGNGAQPEQCAELAHRQPRLCRSQVFLVVIIFIIVIIVTFICVIIIKLVIIVILGFSNI